MRAMKDHKTKEKPGLVATAGKKLSVVLMIFCLIFLTSLNYFIYPQHSDAAQVAGMATDAEAEDTGYPPSGPTEEKSGNCGFSIAEEILHETHPDLNFRAINQIYLHHIAEAEKVELFHPELILPPPKS